MSRPKGPGAIKFLDVKEQGDADMRKILWCGEKAPTPKELKQRLSRLTAEKRLLTVRLAKVSGKRVKVSWKREREPLFRALDNTNKQIEETQKQMEGLAHIPGEPVLGWQERAVFWMTFHKCLDPDPDADHVSSPHGSKITASQLRKQLHDEGFEVGERQLRRFMRKVGALASEQGKRDDSNG